MDSGKAAFYAAIIGFAAAVIGAGVGGWASYRGSRHQVIGGARSEHAHWLRQERRLAYGRLIQATINFRIHEIALFNKTLKALDSSSSPLKDGILSTCYSKETDLFLEVIVAVEELSLFGPTAVRGQGLAVSEGSHRLVKAMTSVATSSGATRAAAKQEYNNARSALDTNLGTFIKLCREDLESPVTL
ncbi:hypothetical protein [Streptomyces sp. NPDC017991]|uniref:hypothetical protein n=1 Tax=Streptomyces sp. NPDC017991 TaxID=3365026 RepID=UPI0037AE98F4